MTELARLTKSEFKKMRHTLLLWLHVCVPVLGMFLFLSYYRISLLNPAGKVAAYLEAVGIAYPLLVGMICAMSVELEEEGNYQTFFITAERKYHAFLAKWTALLICSLGSVLLAVMGFAVGYRYVVGENPYPAAVYLKAALILWAAQIILYAVHLGISFRFGKGASIGIGVVESVLSALMLTGLGDGIWPVFACSWGSRICDYLLLYTAERKETLEAVSGALTRQLSVCAGLFVITVVFVFFWFHRYEGRKCQE